MSTIVSATTSGNYLSIKGDGALVRIFPSGGPERQRDVYRADFLAAVESECGVTVIENATLPEVKRLSKEITVGETYRVTGQEFATFSATRAKEVGLRLLALARHLNAHPPVDEAQVEALATSFAEVAESDGGCKDGWDATIIARRLVAAGWTKGGAA